MTDTAPARYCPDCGTPVHSDPGHRFPCRVGPSGHRPAATHSGAAIPRRRRWPLILAGTVVGLLLATAVPLVVLRMFPDDPDEVARSYFEALAARDADDALALLEPRSRKQTDPPMLTNRTLNDPGYTPPSKPKVTILYALADTSKVKVDYRLGQGNSQLELTLIRTDGWSGGWTIQNGLLPLPLPMNDTGWDTYNVAGTLVPASRPRIEAVFPGMYQIAPLANTVREADPVTVQAGAPDDSRRFVVRLRPTVLQEIEPQVRAYLDKCAGSTDLEPPGCPFHGVSNGPVTDVNWTITAYPILRVQLAAGGEGFVVGQAGAAVLTGRTDSPVAPEFAYSTAFSVSGTARVAEGKVVFVPTR